MGIETDYYFECHLTVEPVFGDRLEELKRLSGNLSFHVADLLMQKRTEDTPERSKNDTFCTAHSKNYFQLETAMKDLIASLKFNGFKVWRYKIENIMLDSKSNDVLGVL